MRHTYLLLGLAAATTEPLEILETEEFSNDCKPHRSCWKGIEPKYKMEDTRQCRGDGDCDADFYCLNHMWTYHEETETGRGCWKRNVCTGTGTYQMFEERVQQYFCSEEQFAENLDTEPPQDWNLVPLPEKHWDEYKPACEVDSD